MQRYYSKIYWHFTGSPDIDWSNIKMPKEIGKPKATMEAVITLKKILKSLKLLATCTEKIIGDLRTSEFCCVCDIPFKDLIYHSNYYGTVAIGFSAKAIHQNFNPVLYIEKSFPIPSNLQINENTILDNDKVFDGDDSAYEFFSYLYGLENNNQYIEYLSNYLGYLRQFVKITRFCEKDEETFYREREWRSREGDFCFVSDDVEAIIVPKEYMHEIKECLAEYGYIEHIPIIPFEFLEKA